MMSRILCLLVIIWPTVAFAADAWTIVDEESSLGFTAKQEGASVDGGFARFSGAIVFDPDELAKSRISITVDMASTSSPYQELVDALIDTPWFNVAEFPKAVFESTVIRSVDGERYQADGTLQLRGIEAPVLVEFGFEAYGPKDGRQDTLRAVANGSAMLPRTVFGVGQDAWQSTEQVADLVMVRFTIVAERALTN